jgi:acyl transferase domain-containing protein
LKSNIGHLENVSGVASLIKSVLMLERGMIAPNADFQTANRKIPLKEWNMKVGQHPSFPEGSEFDRILGSQIFNTLAI